MRRINTFVIATMLCAVTASQAFAAGPMHAGPAYAGNAHFVSCKIYNTSTKSYEVTVEAVAVYSGTVLNTGTVTLDPGGYYQVQAMNPAAQVVCRFTGPTAKKAAATLTIFENSGDFTDTVVLPAR